jgi:hypothetical protein
MENSIVDNVDFIPFRIRDEESPDGETFVKHIINFAIYAWRRMENF